MSSQDPPQDNDDDRKPPAVHNDERLLTLEQMEQEALILARAFRLAARGVDHDRLSNPFCRVLEVHTTALEQMTVQIHNSHAELRAIRETLGMIMGVQSVFEDRLRTHLHAVLPHLFIPGDNAADIAATFPPITPVFRSDADYQQFSTGQVRLDERIAALEQQLQVLNEQVQKMISDVYAGGPRGVTDVMTANEEANRPDPIQPRPMPEYNPTDPFDEFLREGELVRDRAVLSAAALYREEEEYNDFQTAQWRPIGAWHLGQSNLAFRSPLGETGRQVNLSLLDHLLARSVAAVDPSQRLAESHYRTIHSIVREFATPEVIPASVAAQLTWHTTRFALDTERLRRRFRERLSAAATDEELESTEADCYRILQAAIYRIRLEDANLVEARLAQLRSITVEAPPSPTQPSEDNVPDPE